MGVGCRRILDRESESGLHVIFGLAVHVTGPRQTTFGCWVVG